MAVVFRRAVVASAALVLAWCGAAAAQTAVSASPAGPERLAPATQTAQAQPAPSGVKILDEAKLGFLLHDVGVGGHHKEPGYDVNLEMLFASPEIFKILWSPRPHVGTDINTDGRTTSYYAGLTWGGVFYRPNVFVGDGFFAYLALGGAVHDGKLSTTDPQRKSLGSHVLFREGLDVGYQLSPALSVAGFIDHISNANLANRNEGLTNGGMRVGFKF
jgi:lipid A 3-O-deacylase